MNKPADRVICIPSGRISSHQDSHEHLSALFTLRDKYARRKNAIKATFGDEGMECFAQQKFVLLCTVTTMGAINRQLVGYFSRDTRIAFTSIGLLEH